MHICQQLTHEVATQYIFHESKVDDEKSKMHASNVSEFN